VNTASQVILFTGGASPSVHKQLDCAKSLQLLTPHLNHYRREALNSHAVAEVHISNGVTLKFSILDGRIQIVESKPMIGSSAKLLGFIPLPTRKEIYNDASEFNISKVMSRAFSH
jgi:hypothetical protein